MLKCINTRKLNQIAKKYAKLLRKVEEMSKKLDQDNINILQIRI